MIVNDWEGEIFASPNLYVGGKKHYVEKERSKHKDVPVTGNGSLSGLIWALKQIKAFAAICPNIPIIVLADKGQENKRTAAYSKLLDYGFTTVFWHPDGKIYSLADIESLAIAVDDYTDCIAFLKCSAAYYLALPSISFTY